MKLLVEIVTPEKSIFRDEEIDAAVITASEGEITILPGHIPLFTKINPGEMRLLKAGKEISLAVTGGFLEYADNELTILADYAIRSEDIVEENAKKAIENAKKAMAEKTEIISDLEAESALKRALLELKVVQRKKKAYVHES